MFLFLLFNLIFPEMSQNFGSNYFANSKGARALLKGGEAMYINPANLYLDETYTFDINSYYKESLFSLGTIFNFQGELALFASFDSISNSFAYDGFSVLGAYSTALSDRFSLGGAFGYFNSSTYTSELKYSVSASFSPWNLKKKYDKWLVSVGLLSNFLTSDQDQYFTSFSYIQRFYTLSFDVLSSSLEGIDSNNEEVCAFSFLVMDYLKLIASVKMIDFDMGNNLVYGTGIDLFNEQIKLGFAMLFDLNNNNYYSFTVAFQGE